jgi:hypothetical protein
LALAMRLKHLNRDTRQDDQATVGVCFHLLQAQFAMHAPQCSPNRDCACLQVDVGLSR